MASSNKHRCQHCEKKFKETYKFEDIHVCWGCFKNLCEKFRGKWGE